MTQSVVEYAVVDSVQFSTALELAAALNDLASRFPVNAVEGQAFMIHGTAYLYRGTWPGDDPHYFIILAEDEDKAA